MEEDDDGGIIEEEIMLMKLGEGESEGIFMKSLLLLFLVLLLIC